MKFDKWQKLQLPSQAKLGLLPALLALGGGGTRERADKSTNNGKWGRGRGRQVKHS